MKRQKNGQYVTVSTAGEKCRAFVPAPLPPKPALQINASLQDKMDKALLALGRLDSISLLLPDTDIFLYTYIRKEAVLGKLDYVFHNRCYRNSPTSR